MSVNDWTDPRTLPDFPWDRLTPYKERARSRGLIDLSIGTPVDDVPEIIQEALRAAANSPGYPTVWGTPELRAAAAGWMQRKLNVTVHPDAILPTIGSKELVAMLPFQLGLSARDVIAIPAIAYPTYDVGARLAGAAVVVADGVEELEFARIRVEASGRALKMVSATSATPSSRGRHRRSRSFSTASTESSRCIRSRSVRTSLATAEGSSPAMPEW